MRPAPFEYVRPTSALEACQALAEGGTALAGGQSLLPLLKLRATRPTCIVDINRIDGLSGVSAGDSGSLEIGALTRHQDVAEDELLRSDAPILVAAAERIADMQVRARGTIGGNVCFAGPGANMTTALVALGAVAELVETDGSRWLPVEEMVIGAYESAKRPEELLTRIRVRGAPARGPGAYLEVAPQRNGVPVVNVAVVPGDGPETTRVVLGGLVATPCRASLVEKAMAEGPVTTDVIERGVEEVLGGREPYATSRGDALYRARIAQVLIARAVEQAGTNKREI
jgi:carbon-monoxide dehydrogenase medium subunit